MTRSVVVFTPINGHRLRCHAASYSTSTKIAIMLPASRM
jgi:hypothetical protein